MLRVAVEIPLAVLKDHQGGWGFGVVLSGHVDPVVAFHAVVDFAGVNDLVGEFSCRNARLLVGVWGKGGEIEAAAEFLDVDEIVKGMEFTELLDAGGGIPNVGVVELAHLRTGSIVNEQCGF